MFVVETYAAVRRLMFLEGHSQREAPRVFGLSRDTIAMMCWYLALPGYVRTRPAGKPKLGALLPMIAAILEADRAGPPKRQHTAKRIFERLRDEHRYGGGYTVVKDHVWRQRGRAHTIRARVEAAIGRFKRVIGDRLCCRTDQRRATEVDVAVHVLNRMLELRRPISVRIA